MVGRVGECEELMEEEIKEQDRITKIVLFDTDIRYEGGVFIHNSPPAARTVFKEMNDQLPENSEFYAAIEGSIAMNEMLWEIYDMVNEVFPNTAESKEAFERKWRNGQRPNRRTLNRRILTHEQKLAKKMKKFRHHESTSM
ncbi:unnamed protein product [Nippostrongylus brasiliensis]|uniref:Prohead core protein n=1 Tax=Nippostrongylus brasiliensis TaxID=27835 RepID=A0A0N4YYK2_NIPBR|nr:unnamed protein product [Nippostrongylus brasiliensis]